MSMELLGNEFIEEFIPPPTRTAHGGSFGRCHRGFSMDRHRGCVPALGLYPSRPQPRRARRSVAGMMDRFGGDVDWSGYESARANLWHRQLHIFTHPFYYIEYGIAQLGALQVWANSKRNKAKSLADYKRALALAVRGHCRNCFPRRAANFNLTPPPSDR